MNKKHLHQWLLFTLLLTMVGFNSFSQSVKRQCISSYGSGIMSTNLTFTQTAGQCFGTTTSSTSNQTAVLQGFQQPFTFSIVDISSTPLKNLDIMVYPNPTSYSITFKSDMAIGESLIQVSDINGKRILTEKVQLLNLHQLNCESWTNGVYNITIQDSEQNFKTLRLVISK